MSNLSSQSWSIDESAARDLDAACDRFERAWQETPSSPPRLEDFLPPEPETTRAAYFRELFAIELHYRGRNGGIVREEYFKRFPTFAPEIAVEWEADAVTILERLGVLKLQRFAAGTAVQVPGYEIGSLLGRGAMGVVYRSRQVRLNREVALKILLSNPHPAENETARFRTETEAVARLNHLGIVQVYDAGECGTLGDDAVAYLAMEYCPGGSLAAKLGGNPIPPREAAELVERLARAIHVAHAAGVVHRDLKPSNILLDAHGCPKVADFGLAKLLDDAGRTHSGALLGTPAYMAPEQAEGNSREVGPLADVYSLGAILYECLTGRPPFKAPSVSETLEQVRHAEPVPVRHLQPGTPRDLETIALKCLRKDGWCRYRSAVELGDDLAAFLEGRPIRARPARALERGWRWACSHPALAGLYLVSLLAILLLGLGVWFRVRLDTTEARLDAEAARAEAARALEKAARVEADAQKFVALTSQLRARIARPSPGWTWAALDEIRQVAGLPRAAGTLAELRSDAAECLSGMDVRFVRALGEGLSASSIAWSPDGKTVAVGQHATNFFAPSCNITLLRPDLSGQPLTLSVAQKFTIGSAGPTVDYINVLAFSRGGRLLAAGTRSGWVAVWDLSRPGSPAWNHAGHASSVSGLSFSGDGRSLYSTGGKTVQRWEAATGTVAATFIAEQDVTGLDVHPVEGWVAATTDQVVRLSALTLRPFGVPFPLRVNPIAFSPDGIGLLAAENDRVAVWHVEAREHARTIPLSRTSSGERISGLACSGDGGLVLTASSSGPDRHVRLFDLLSGGLVAQLTLEGGRGKVAFAPDGRRFAVTGEKRIQLYEVGSPHQQTRVALHQEKPVRAFGISSDGRTLVTEARPTNDWGLSDLKTWDLEKPGRECTGRNLIGTRPGQAVRLSLSPPGNEVASVARSEDGVLQYWTPSRSLERTGDKVPDVRQLEYDREGRLWAVAGEEVLLWDAGGRRIGRHRHLAGLATQLTGKPGLLAIAPGQRLTAVGSKDGSLLVLQPGDSGLQVLTCRPVSKSELTAVALSADETLAMAGTDTGELIVTNLPSGEMLHRATPHEAPVSAIRSSGNGVWASGDRRGLVRLWRWDGKGPQELLSLRHHGPVRDLRFHADGVQLFVLIDGEHGVRVHHLDRLRSRLDELGLGDGLEVIQKLPLPHAAKAEVSIVRGKRAGSNGLKREDFRTPFHQELLRTSYGHRTHLSGDEVAAGSIPPLAACSSRLSGWLRAPKAGRYLLTLEGEIMARLWLDGVLLLESWKTPNSVEVELTDRPHALRIDQIGSGEERRVRLTWNAARGNCNDEIPLAFLFSDRKVGERATLPAQLYVVEAMGAAPGVTGQPHTLAFSTDGRQVYYGTTQNGRGVVSVWDGAKRNQELPGDIDKGIWEDFSPDLRLGLYQTRDGELKVHDLAARKTVQTLRVPEHSLHGGRFSPDGKGAIAVPGAGLWVWQPGTTEPRWSEVPLKLRDIAWSPDGKLVYLCRSSPGAGILEFRTAAEGRVVSRVELPADDWKHSLLRASGDGKFLVVANAENRMVIVDLVKGKVRRSWNPHYGHGQVRDLAISPDNRLLVTVGRGGGQVWDLWGRNVACFGDPGRTLIRIAFAPDGKSFATGGNRRGHYLQLWRLREANPKLGIQP